MLPSVLQFLISAAVIIAAGSVLTQFGDIISHRTKLGGLLVGSILIAGATSLPELAVDVNAVRMGAPDLAVGDLMGSSLFNLLILAVLDLTRYSHGRMLSETSARHALAASVSIALTAVAAIFILLGPRLESATFLRIGPGSVALVAAYVLGIRLIFCTRVEPEKTSRKSPPSWIPGVGKLKLKGAIVGYVIAAIIILAAAPVLAQAADELAKSTGLGGTFFGSTFVALCTSLPEMVTTFTAVRMKAFDMALGNVFGSNCFNMVLLVPLDFVDPGSLLSSVAQTHAYTALCAIVVTAVVILGQLFRVERKKPFVEPDALLAIFLVLCSLVGLYLLKE
ncbi:MAG TPA: sodium:proton exchanger [Verrucomicrobiales bacterium]|nr:sodium:proton exchanger [Verrucomicrobiales bacterium]